ncbi:MAG TPA: hypothetical protein VIZ65_16605 [Cellvibrionaceae bacterium]
MAVNTQYPGYDEVFSSAGAGRIVYARSNQAKEIKKMIKMQRINYQYTLMAQGIATLSADPSRGRALNTAGDMRQLVVGDGVSMTFYLYNGAVFVESIAIGTVVKTGPIGIYKIDYVKARNFWVTDTRAVIGFDPAELWRSKGEKAHYAVVGDKFDLDIGKAGRLLAEHVLGGYSAKQHFIKEDITGREKPHFSLLWLDKEKHKSAPAVNLLSTAIVDSYTQGLPVNWLVHGQAVHTFKKAVNQIKSSINSSALRVTDGVSGIKQQVYFSNPASGSKDSLKKLCENSGFAFVGYNANERDIKRVGNAVNVGLEMGKQAFIAAAGGGGVAGVGFGLKQLGLGGIDKAIQNSADALVNGNHITAAVCALGCGFIVWGAVKKWQTIGAGVRCTVGKGNQYWYANDKDLLAAE